MNALTVDTTAAAKAAVRRRSRQFELRWGARTVRFGGDSPVMVQSMTNTDTADPVATAIQVRELAAAGSEAVRITVNSPAAGRQGALFRATPHKNGGTGPLVG